MESSLGWFIKSSLGWFMESSLGWFIKSSLGWFMELHEACLEVYIITDILILLCKLRCEPG